MRKVKFLVLKLIAVTGLGLTGCSNSPKIPEPQIYHNTSKLTIIRTPALDTIKKVEIGENLYQKTNERAYDTYNVILIKPEKISDDHWIDIKATSPILYKWTSSDLNTICRFDKSRCWVDANKTNAFTYDFEDLHDASDMAIQRSPVEYKLIPTLPTYAEDSFKYQALYQGRIDNKIKISFREFKDDMARPAFTQDIDYELNKSGDTIVGFKGLRIKILKATNTDITYSVIQDYN